MSKSGARLVEWLLAAALVLALIAYAYLGSYSRYMADDYSALRPVSTHGFVGAQISWYQAWTGRFSYTFLYSLLALLGPSTPQFVPAALLCLWFAATLWATYQILSLSGEISWARVVLFAGFIIFATLETAPNLAQSLYWQTAAVTHVTPFIPLSLYVALISQAVSKRHKQLSRKFSIACAGILTFLAGGLADAYVVFQSGALIFSILALEIFAGTELKSRIRVFLVVGLTGSLLALTILVASPGNSIRQAFFPRQFGGWQILGVAVLYSLRFIAKLVLKHPFIFIASISLPALVALRDLPDRGGPPCDRRLCMRVLFITPIVVFLSIMCCTGASVYAISVMLPERARILLSLTVVCGTLVWGRAAGEYLVGKLFSTSYKRKRITSLSATMLLSLLILLPLISCVSILRIREQARSFAADWDRQDLQLRTAKQSGVTDVTVQQIGDFQSRIGKGPSDLHLRTDPSFWINRTTASYYGLRSVTASNDVAIVP